MSVDAATKRKLDSPNEHRAKKPRTSEGKKEKHSKPRSSDGKKKHHKSSEREHNKHHSSKHRTSDETAEVDNEDSDDNAGAVSPYRKVSPFLHMAVPPVFGGDPARSVAELFDTMLLQYVPELEGVLVTHHAGPKCFQRPTGRIEADGAFGLVPVKVGCLVWSPRIGMKLEGKITLSSPSHVSLLLDGLFNASISSQHLDLSQWEFVHEEQEEEQEHAREFTEGEEEDVKPQIKQEDDEQPHSLGYWRNKYDFERLGGASGKVTFTVVSMTVAKHMLTLHGSLLSRPFSVPPPDEQDQGIDAALPPMEGDARAMTTSQRIMYNRRQHLLEQRRQQQQKAKEESDSPVKSQNKRVRWDDDDEAEHPATTLPPSAADQSNGAIAGGAQGTKITFD